MGGDEQGRSAGVVNPCSENRKFKTGENITSTTTELLNSPTYHIGQVRPRIRLGVRLRSYKILPNMD